MRQRRNAEPARQHFLDRADHRDLSEELPGDTRRATMAEVRNYLRTLEYIEAARTLDDLAYRLLDVYSYTSGGVRDQMSETARRRAEKLGYFCAEPYPPSQCAEEILEFVQTREDTQRNPKLRRLSRSEQKREAQRVRAAMVEHERWVAEHADEFRITEEDIESLYPERRRNAKEQLGLFGAKQAEVEGFALTSPEGSPVGRVRPPKGTQQELVSGKVSAEEMAKIRAREIEERAAKRKAKKRSKSKKAKKNPELVSRAGDYVVIAFDAGGDYEAQLYDDRGPVGRIAVGESPEEAAAEAISQISGYQDLGRPPRHRGHQHAREDQRSLKRRLMR